MYYSDYFHDIKAPNNEEMYKEIIIDLKSYIPTNLEINEIRNLIYNDLNNINICNYSQWKYFYKKDIININKKKLFIISKNKSKYILNMCIKNNDIKEEINKYL